MSNVSNNSHVKYHSHTYPSTEAILFRNYARPPCWMRATAVAFISLPGVHLLVKNAEVLAIEGEVEAIPENFDL